MLNPPSPPFARIDHKRIVELLLRKPSLNIRCKNSKGEEGSQICNSQEMQGLYEKFFSFQKTLMQNHPRLQIQTTQQENINKMFTNAIKSPQADFL